MLQNLRYNRLIPFVQINYQLLLYLRWSSRDSPSSVDRVDDDSPVHPGNPLMTVSRTPTLNAGKKPPCKERCNYGYGNGNSKKPKIGVALFDWKTLPLRAQSVLNDIMFFTFRVAWFQAKHTPNKQVQM